MFALAACNAHTVSSSGFGPQSVAHFLPDPGSVFPLSGGGEKILVNFTGTLGKDPGANPQSRLEVAEKVDTLYGTTTAGGKKNDGTIFSLSSGIEHYWTPVLHTIGGSFYGSTFPLSPTTPRSLITTAESGGKGGDGTVLALIYANGAYTGHVIHSFVGSDGANSYSGLISPVTGIFVGYTLTGGAHDDGTAFELTSQGKFYKFTSIFNFNGTDGKYPRGEPVSDAAGDVFGPTIAGGTHGLGTVFELLSDFDRGARPSNSKFTEKVIHNFAGGSKDGAGPYAGLIMDKSGNLYGTTINGGSFNLGVAFELKRSGAHYVESVLHSFGGGSDGAQPYGSLLFGTNGVLYGTTEGGGAYGLGTAYKLAPSGGKYVEMILYSFAGGPNDGGSPEAGLVSVNGVLYGTTYGGGTSNDGTIFSLKP
ncbi:MAG TPA: choice-of-anchor tandem repeat GloVer-containing protein [Candidatus Cybelea sp.]